MAKARTHYECTACGAQYPKWNGRCTSCGAWNTIEESLPEIKPQVRGSIGTGNARGADLSAQIRELSEIGTNEDIRYDTGISELNRVLGGGLVKGSVILLGGEPGIGKSTLLLQICQHLGEDHSVLYVQGKGRDEKTEYIKLDAHVEALIRDYLKARGESKAEAPLFASMSNNSKGGRMTTRAISGIAKAHMVGAGYNSDKLTAHSLRHTAVTLSLLAGRPLEEVQQFARHANMATTMIYNHALDKAKNGCSEAIAKAIL